ncbi:unnamed protein product [Mesocestoides corti]|uniref:Uncharacterized protein n=1 Tax=Mesocestoides corti TaxID=53468 RepID=A0A0R3UR41_MESCO|nr:unnamed protein product [Mesocestoides corti]
MEKLAESLVATCSPTTPFPITSPQYEGAGSIYAFLTRERRDYHDLLCTVDASAYSYANDTCASDCQDYKHPADRFCCEPPGSLVSEKTSPAGVDKAAVDAEDSPENRFLPTRRDCRLIAARVGGTGGHHAVRAV